MCGIAGVFNLDGSPLAPFVLECMTRKLIHRGPDGIGFWSEGPVGLGHTRLAIRDLSNAGHQPMSWGDNEIIVTYNGEIYNELDIKRELATQHGCSFHSHCDAEVLAPAYKYWGPAAFSRLQGMFALAIWDPEHRHLVLARDPIGIKPLYYNLTNRSLRFASEIKALTQILEHGPELDPRSLHAFLGQGYPGPEHSLVEGIRPLPPGSLLIADAKGIRLERYWAPKRTGEIVNLNAAVEEFEPLWRKIVHDHLISDVPLGLLLSGGIDSSLIAANLRSHSREVSGFTAGFSLRDFDETDNATAVARHSGLKHHTLSIDNAISANRFLSVVAHFDGQCADSSALAFHAVCEAAAQRQKVALTGDGADEFFGGYPTYRATRFATIFGAILPSSAARLGIKCLERIRSDDNKRLPWTEATARWLRGLSTAPTCPHPQWRRYSFPSDLDNLYTTLMLDSVDARDALDDYADYFRHASGDLVDRCLIADQSYYLPGDLLMKADAMSMAHGLEVRVPFLDRRIMEFAGKLHSSLLTPLLGPDKRILREAARRAGIPPSIAKAAKRGFNVPVAHLLRNSLNSLGKSLLFDQADLLSPYINPDGVRRLWNAHQERHANHGYLLWSLLTLAAWRSQLASATTHHSFYH